MKLLLTTPSLKILSGVANHYAGLKPYWTEDIKYLTVGSRSGKTGRGKWFLPFDIIKVLSAILIWRPDALVINPSMNPRAIKRDFLIKRLAEIVGCKTVVFNHGFNFSTVASLNHSHIAAQINRSKGIIVLSSDIRSELRKWGVTVPIELTTTKVEDTLLGDFNPASRSGEIKNILFLARIVRGKGIYEAIDTIALLKKRHPEIKMTVAGDGEELQAARQYAETKNLGNNVIFTGRLDGDALKQIFIDTDAYLFPSYSEGMPTSVLEAMAFGLPIVTTRVGGLPDFFESRKMGFMTDTPDPASLANHLSTLISDRMLTRQIGLYNASFAREHFMASRIAPALESTIKSLISARTTQ